METNGAMDARQAKTKTIRIEDTVGAKILPLPSSNDAWRVSAMQDPIEILDIEEREDEDESAWLFWYEEDEDEEMTESERAIYSF